MVEFDEDIYCSSCGMEKTDGFDLCSSCEEKDPNLIPMYCDVCGDEVDEVNDDGLCDSCETEEDYNEDEE